MNLVWFLTVGTIFSVILGEFGQYPFGVTSSSISLTDLLLVVALFFLLVWNVGIKKDVKFLGAAKLLSIFWGVGFLSLIFSGDLSGGLYLIRFILYSSSLLLGYKLVAAHRNIEEILRTVVFSLTILLGIGFTQMIVFPDMSLLTDFGFDPHQNRMFATILDPNFLGMILNIGFVFSLYLFIKENGKIWLVLSLLFCLGILLTFSRSTYLAFLTEAIILGLFRMKKLLFITIIATILLFVLVPKFNERIVGGVSIDKTASERIESWQRGLIIFEKNPIFGVGFNNVRSRIESENLLKTYSIDGGNSGGGVDSSIVFVLATTGIIGFSSYLLFWGTLLGRIIQYKKHSTLKISLLAMIAGLIVHSQFVNSLFFPPIMFLYFLILGAFLCEQD